MGDDRWHQLAAAILESNLPASDKAIFRFLLGKADYGTADLPARFTPTQRVMGRKTSHSLRQVKYSLGHLARHGWLVPGQQRRVMPAGMPMRSVPDGRVTVPAAVMSL